MDRKEKSKTPEKQEKVPEETGSKRKRKSTSGGGGSGAVEARTPLKRQRVPVQKFQSPAEEIIPVPSTSKQKDQLEMLHKKGSFLGVRGDEGSFYLCKCAQNVFTNTRKFKIQWLDLEEPPDVYKIDFLDSTDADCILTNVRMERVARDTYRLPIKEQKRIEEILHRALKKERGEPIDESVIQIDSGEEEEVEDEEDDDEEWEEEPTPKKAKVQPKSRKAVAVSAKAGKSSKSKTAKDKKSGKDKDKKKEEKKKGPDRHLQPNPKIKVIEKEPFFETNNKVDFVSKKVQAKLAIRAVLNKDHKLLKSLLEDSEKCYKLDVFRSVDVQKTALHYALERNDHEAVKLLVKDFFCNSVENERLKKGSPQAVLIEASSTGRYNPMSLGVRAIRQISAARGSKQGDDAFVMDNVDLDVSQEDYLHDALKLGVTKETLDIFMSSNPDNTKEELMENAVENIYLAVLCGNRKLAGQLIEEIMKDGDPSGFGYLHKDVLLFDKEELRQTILASSVKKKPWSNKSITPLHCAAINPNVNYLQRLLTVEPNINLEDRDHRRPIHFAAVCEGVGPLEFLLHRGASPLEVDTQGMTPLHYACSAGRPRNVDILLKKVKEASSKQGDVGYNKWGAGGVDKPSRSSYCPIHIAVSYNHADVLKILIKHQVDINKAMSAGKNRITPLMIAASHGSLDIARILVQNGASIEQLDKLKRTALTHAVINGNTNVASYLLYLGANPNRCDSSDNSLVHYAAAYGWQFVLKLLLDAGAEPNKASYWKTTPIGIAFLKGHIGIVDYLLKQPGVDINFKNDAGMTLASVAASSAIVSGLFEQMQYLLENNADPTIKDGSGADTLHHLAGNTSGGDSMTNEQRMDLTVKVAELLLDAGCDPGLETDDGKTALMFAIEKSNVKLVRLLVDKGATVTSHKSDSGKTILHLMADLCMGTDVSPILKILVDERPTPSEPVKAEKKKVVIENGEVSEIIPQKAEGKGEGDKKKEEEAMEVDDGEKKKDVTEDKPAKEKVGDAPVNGNVNGMEGDEQPPKLKRVRCVSFVSQEDIWPVMANEVDNDGFTPLLWACKVYRDFKKGYHQSDEDLKKCSENGRNFIKALIELASSDVSATVKEKLFVGDPPPTDKKLRYTREGKASILHLLLHVGHEIVEGLECLGMELVLKYSPDLEHRNLNEETALILAVEAKSEKALSLLIKAGANVNVSFGTEITGIVTPLHIAAEGGNRNIIKMLLDAGANVKIANSKTLQTPLHIAVQRREDEGNVLEIVRMILAEGADINAGTVTPLHLAVLANLGTSNASTELEEFLVSKGANAFARDEKGRIPLHYAFITKSAPDSTSSLDPIELCSVLTDSMRDKDLDVKDEKGRTPLHLAAVRGATICCVHLLQRNVGILNLDNDGFSALSLAVKNRHDSCAIMLLQKGASVENKIVIPPTPKADWREYYTTSSDKKKPLWVWTPSHIAGPISKEETLDIYQMAISRELQGVAHMVLDTSGITGKAVEAALRVNKYHIVLRHLHRIKDNNILRAYKNAEGQNLLHILSLFTVPGMEVPLQLKVARALVDKGVSLSQLDSYGRYPLVYVALKHQSVQLAKFFLEKRAGLDLNLKDKYSRTVMVAYFWDQQKIYEHGVVPHSPETDFMQLLVAAGASLDVVYSIGGSTSPLFDMNFVEHPLDYFSPIEHSSMVTPLISTIHNSDFGLAKYILKNGASPNLADPNGVTPLMHAVRSNDFEMVKLLLNHDYEIAGKEPHELQIRKPLLKKKLSRRVFAIKPATQSKADDQDEEENDVQNDENDEENKDVEYHGDEDGDDDGDDGGDDAESDHDTDIVDDEDEEDNEDDNDHDAQLLPIPRLGSKQPSMKRTATGLVEEAEEFKTVTKTSSVDLDAKDNKGWTAVHHVVSPLDYGTLDSEEMLYILAKAGASLTVENKDGETPLQMAIKKCASGLVKRIQTLMEVDPTEQEVIKTFPQFHPWTYKDENLPEERCRYEPDAQAMLERLAPAEDSKTKSKPKVDKKCMAADYGEVVFDTDSEMPYDVILSQIEIRRFLTDTYNFYKMQVIWHKTKDIYILFTKWGRIGDSGQYQQTPFQKRSEVISEFCKIFKSKTANLWSNVKSFKKQPKKYQLVEIESQPLPVVKVDINLQSSIPSKLPEDVQDLLKEMADVGMMQAAMKRDNMAEEYMPFGRIKRDALITGRKTLQQLGDIVLEMEKKKRTMTYDNDEHQKDCETIARLSTEYYCLVPQEGYAFDRISPLGNICDIKTQMRLVSNLLDLELACKIMLGAQYKISEVNPLNYIYSAMGCTIQPLREEDVESQYILKYIRSSSEKSKVICIYKLFEVEKEKRFASLNMTNHRMLWHGSGVSNFMSILHSGLMVAPHDAPITGHAFGEGIYTSDSFAKCAMYSYNPNPKSRVKLALLCEVALGNCKEDVDSSVEIDLVHSEFNSLKIHGRTAPHKDWDVTLPYGAKMPLSCAKDNSWTPPDKDTLPHMAYSEYILQQQEQVCMRYLVQFV